MKKFLLRIFGFLLILYVIVCGYMYYTQESFIFHPEKLSQSMKLNYSIPFEEVSIPVIDAEISGVYFKVPNSKGLIFFLHGNTGNLLDQEEHAKFYNQMGFDFFALDYRGFGKSTGKIKSEKQFFNDIQIAYNFVQKEYAEKDITVVGYSVGTCAASMITKTNNPNKLILIAPYYSLSDMTVRRYKILPTFLLKYKFDTYKYLESNKNEILLIHGTDDETLPFEGAQQLSLLLDANDEFLPLKNQGHNNFEENVLFRSKVEAFLMH